MTKLKIAVLGAGLIGRLHCDRIANSDVATLAGVADPSPAGADVARQFSAQHFADHRHLLDTVKPDAVVVATPNELHIAMAFDAVARKIPALVEKPIATRVADGEALRRAADAAGVPVLVGHHRRHNPLVKCARDVIASGTLGRIASVTILSTVLKPPPYFDAEWRRKPGGGPVLINLIHEIDLIRHLCGEIASVQAIGSNAVRGFEVEDTVAVALRLVNGALVTVSLTDTAAAPWSYDLSVRESPNYPAQPVPVASHFIAGTQASLSLPTLEFWSYKGKAGWFEPLTREVLPYQPGDPYTAQLHHFCDVVRGTAIPVTSAADATATLRATLAVLDAMRTGAILDLTTG